MYPTIQEQWINFRDHALDPRWQRPENADVVAFARRVFYSGALIGMQTADRCANSGTAEKAEAIRRFTVEELWTFLKSEAATMSPGAGLWPTR